MPFDTQEQDRRKSLSIITVIKDNDSFVVQCRGYKRPILGSGGSQIPLRNGWEPHRLLDGIPCVFVLQLKHEAGAKAIWFLDGDLHFIGNTVDALSVGVQEAVSQLGEITDDFFDNVPVASYCRGITPLRRPTDQIALHGVPMFRRIDPDEASEHNAFWRTSDYLVVRNALTSQAIDFLRSRIKFAEEGARTDARQFYRHHNDTDSHRVINEFLGQSVGFYETVLGIRLAPTYGFAMNYVKGADMLPHYDNRNNPVSSTVCYHFEAAAGMRNPIHLDRAKFQNPYTRRLTVKDRSSIPADNIASLDLRPGDIGIFRGRNHLHWRDPITDDMDYRAVLLHFNDYVYKDETIKDSVIEHISDTAFVDIENYDDFRRAYAMYFESRSDSWI